MTAPSPTPPVAARSRFDGRQRALLVLDGLLAVGAFGGSWGLISGSVDADTYVHRLPFHSTGLGGIALAVVVAVPAMVAFVATWAGRRWSAVANLVVGAMLMGWIVVQVGFIGLTSWLQPLMFVWGGAILALGASERRRSR